MSENFYLTKKPERDARNQLEEGILEYENDAKYRKILTDLLKKGWVDDFTQLINDPELAIDPAIVRTCVETTVGWKEILSGLLGNVNNFTRLVTNPKLAIDPTILTSPEVQDGWKQVLSDLLKYRKIDDFTQLVSDSKLAIDPETIRNAKIQGLSDLLKYRKIDDFTQLVSNSQLAIDSAIVRSCVETRGGWKQFLSDLLKNGDTDYFTKLINNPGLAIDSATIQVSAEMAGGWEQVLLDSLKNGYVDYFIELVNDPKLAIGSETIRNAKIQALSDSLKNGYVYYFIELVNDPAMAIDLATTQASVETIGGWKQVLSNFLKNRKVYEFIEFVNDPELAIDSTVLASPEVQDGWKKCLSYLLENGKIDDFTYLVTNPKLAIDPTILASPEVQDGWKECLSDLLKDIEITNFTQLISDSKLAIDPETIRNAKIQALSDLLRNRDTYSFAQLVNNPKLSIDSTIVRTCVETTVGWKKILSDILKNRDTYFFIKLVTNPELAIDLAIVHTSVETVGGWKLVLSNLLRDNVCVFAKLVNNPKLSIDSTIVRTCVETTVGWKQVLSNLLRNEEVDNFIQFVTNPKLAIDPETIRNAKIQALSYLLRNEKVNDFTQLVTNPKLAIDSTILASPEVQDGWKEHLSYLLRNEKVNDFTQLVTNPKLAIDSTILASSEVQNGWKRILSRLLINTLGKYDVYATRDFTKLVTNPKLAIDPETIQNAKIQALSDLLRNGKVNDFIQLVNNSELAINKTILASPEVQDEWKGYLSNLLHYYRNIDKFTQLVTNPQLTIDSTILASPEMQDGWKKCLSDLLKYGGEDEFTKLVSNKKLAIDPETIRNAKIQALSGLLRNRDTYSFIQLVSNPQLGIDPAIIQEVVTNQVEILFSQNDFKGIHTIQEHLAVYVHLSPERIAQKRNELVLQENYKTVFENIIFFYPDLPSPKDVEVVSENLSYILEQSSDKEKTFDYVVNIFGRNHLPYAGKVMMVFKELFGKEKLEHLFGKRKNQSRISPELQDIFQADDSKESQTGNLQFNEDHLKQFYRSIFEKVLSIDFTSNNTSLREYLETLKKGKDLLRKGIDQEESLTEEERLFLDDFLVTFTVLLDVTKHTIQEKVQDADPKLTRFSDIPLDKVKRIRTRLQALEIYYAKLLGFDTHSGYTTENVSEFLLAKMEEERERTNAFFQERFRSLSQNDSVEDVLKNTGFFHKGIDEKYFEKMQNNGNKSPEFLSGDTPDDRDSTPFDADWLYSSQSKGETSWERLRSTVNGTYANGVYLISLDDGDFRVTRQNISSPCDVRTNTSTASREVFSSGVVGQDHYSEMVGSRNKWIIGLTDKALLPSIKQTLIARGEYRPIVTFNERNELTLLFPSAEYEKERRKYETSFDVVDSRYDNPLHWKEIAAPSGKSGSNEQRWFEDMRSDHKEQPDQYLCKLYKESLQAISEHFFCEILHHFGQRVPETYIGKIGERVAFVSKILPDAKTSPSSNEHMYEGVLLSMWIANWDAKVNDNVLYTPDNHPIYVDNGGAGRFRAQGKTKGTDNTIPFDKNVGELSSMREGRFSSITDDVLRKQADQMFQVTSTTTPAEFQKTYLSLRRAITEIYTSSGLEHAEYAGNISPTTREILIERLDTISQKYFPQFETATPMSMLERIPFNQNDWIREHIQEYSTLASSPEQAYQHNDVSLIKHIDMVRDAVMAHPEFTALNEEDKKTLLLGALFHDIAKPTGEKGKASRDFGHGEKSVEIFSKYAKFFECSNIEAGTISLLIRYDNYVTDYLRGKLGRMDAAAQQMSRQEFQDFLILKTQEMLASTESMHTRKALELLRMFNKSDAIAALSGESSLKRGEDAFKSADQEYGAFFDELMTRL